MATYADMEELIRLGAYRPGSSPEVDEAIRLHQPLEAFLAPGQGRSNQPWLRAISGLEQILEAIWKPKTNVIGPSLGHLNSPERRRAALAGCRLPSRVSSGLRGVSSR